MSTNWGDAPVSLSGMAHNSSSIRAATQQFIQVPLSQSSSIAATRKTIILKFESNGDLVVSTGNLTPMDEWLMDHQATLNEAAAFLSDLDNLKDLDSPEKYLLKKGHQPSEIVNRIRFYMTDVLRVQLSPQTIHQLGEHLITKQTPTDTLATDDVRPVPSMTKIVEGKQTLSNAPGRYEEEEYNVGRGKFLTHQVADLSLTTPGLADKIKEYWETVPTSTNGVWDKFSKTGLLIRAPNEDLVSQTTFNVTWTQNIMTLNAGSTVVASFDVHDVDKLAPECHKMAQRQDAPNTSVYYNLTATKFGVVFFTPAAIRWMIDNKCSDSMVSPRHIRVCIGFDPLFSRWTKDGYAEAAMLMDDRLKSIGQQRMMLRVLTYSAGPHLTNLVANQLCGRYTEFVDQYSPSVVDRFGISNVPRFDAAQPPDVKALQSRIAELESKLASATDMIHSVPVPSGSPSNSKLLAKITELTRQNKELLLKQSDIQREKPSKLDVYLSKHVCVNAKEFERELLLQCEVPAPVVNDLMERRAVDRMRFESRLGDEAAKHFEPKITDLTSQLTLRDLEIDALTEQCLEKTQAIADLEAKLDEVTEELRQVKNRALSTSAELHRMSKITTVGSQYCSEAPPDAYELKDKQKDWADMVDEL
ncbi:mu NS [Pycnonotidae orthoreovirus]|uniref:Mu NS n=1 Tax=Pycnonotidae orthoreovirus TaxID=3070176 RepID=A0A0B6VHD6_9REOV|nr:mu NS [Avian orthoreovirus]BAQ19498.1 mu NS [Avian orthoreovirus]